jgi:hypothetical protein
MDEALIRDESRGKGRARREREGRKYWEKEE